MDQNAIHHASEIVKAQAGLREMTEDEMTSMVGALVAKFQGVDSEEESQPQGQEPAVDPAKSIKDKSIYCIECGKRARMLSKKHLESHGLTPEQYREKWGLKKGQSLVCKELAKQRKEQMKSMELWKRREAVQASA